MEQLLALHAQLVRLDAQEQHHVEQECVQQMAAHQAPLVGLDARSSSAQNQCIEHEDSVQFTKEKEPMDLKTLAEDALDAPQRSSGQEKNCQGAHGRKQDQRHTNGLNLLSTECKLFANLSSMWQ